MEGESDSIINYDDLVAKYPVFGDGWVNRWFSTFKDKNIGGKGSKTDSSRQVPESFINSIKAELGVGQVVSILNMYLTISASPQFISLSLEYQYIHLFKCFPCYNDLSQNSG